MLSAGQEVSGEAVFDNLDALTAYVATEAHLDPASLFPINRTLAFAFDKVIRQMGR